MENKFKLEKQSINQWIAMEKGSRLEGLEKRCNQKTVQNAIEEFEKVNVVSVNLVDECMGVEISETCHVVLEEICPGGSTVTINVWIPLDWNGRFFGCVGGGTRTFHMYDILGKQNRIAMPAYVLKNGFATANTDGGVPGETFVWGLDEETKGIDYELIINLSYRSTHSMTLIAKKVITAIYGVEPQYSYLQGASGGGRQSLMEAQMYPEDYDGIWAVDPAINWTELFMSFIWPMTVMNSERHIISPDKLEFFRSTAIRKANGKRDFIESIEMPDFDPYEYVGQEAADGVITENDAKVMKYIFEGPKTREGRFLWYGFRPGTRFWNKGEIGAPGPVFYNKSEDDTFVPVLNPLAIGYHSAWLERNLEWDGKDLDYKKFEEMIRDSHRDFQLLQCNSPDFRELRDQGTKLLLTHSVNDDTIPADGTLDYYKRVIEYMGREEDVLSYLRFFFTPGGGHTDLKSPGLSLTLADGMIALMKWVEEGIAPESLPTVQYDFKQKENILTGNVELYRLGKSKVAYNIQETEAWAKWEATKVSQNTFSKFNQNTPINMIMMDAQGKRILNEYIGSLLENPQMAQAMGMSLGALADMMPMSDMKKKIKDAIEQLTKL
ncbi:MAG: tannase/feruloyl esterase family alpha/beta hydrolase [Lachnospiraceae bacterium]